MDGWGILTLAFVVGCIGFGAGWESAKASHDSVYLLADCEKNLPRSKHCVLKAVPSAEGETR